MKPTPQTLLAALREKMQQHQIAAWIIPTADPHLSEYLPEHWQSRALFSGFTGSAGTLVVQTSSAQLWTDSRYWVQAARQLAGSGIALKKLGAEGSPIADLADTLPAGSRIGIAPDMLSLAEQRSFQTALSAKNITLLNQGDLAAEVWPKRPSLPSENIYIHPAPFAAETAAAKLARVRSAMQQAGADWHLLSSLDDIAWLTNLRSSDVFYNPVFLSFLLIGNSEAALFTDLVRLPEAARKQLAEAGIAARAYGEIGQAVAQISGTLLLDAAKTAVSTLQTLPQNVRLIEQTAPSTLFKAVKSAAEAEHIREAMRQDGAALCTFFADFEARLAHGETLTELDVDRLLTAERARRPHYISDSFNTIAGFNANGALPHYSATPEAHAEIRGDGLLLIDSGGQYLNGTTDITRVVPIGTPNAAQKRDFTLVLKAHIALARAVFPENTSGAALDGICRTPLWQAQCDFGHGTGHGVGYFLNVHEGPQSISPRQRADNLIRAGMLTSNEPALYREGQWGIRIENLVLACEAVPSENSRTFGRFLRFETVTLCPIDTRLIERSLLDETEAEWLNNYHASVRQQLLPLVSGAAGQWLIDRTEAV